MRGCRQGSKNNGIIRKDYIAETLRLGASAAGWSPGADDGRPEREKMKNWTIEELYYLWRGRGYAKKEAQAKAEKDYKEMHRNKSDSERHQIAQEML